MKNFDPIPFNLNWQFGSAELLPSLTDWNRYSFSAGETNELRHVFDLEPIDDVCLRFFLHIEAAPEATAVIVNGRQVGVTPDRQPLVVDVTDYVTLEDNVLLLTISQPGKFGDIWLERVACETD